jgi:uncharacterized protein YkwD
MKLAYFPLWLPLFVCAVLGLACGVPLPPESITATAEAETALKAAGGDSVSQASNLSGPGMRTLNASIGTDEAIATREVPATPMPLVNKDEAKPAPTPTPSTSLTHTSVALDSAAGPNPAFNNDMIRLLNETRTRSGLGPLSVNSALVLAADAYARTMGERNFFGHAGLDGSTPQGRTAGAGYAGRYRGEALSAGQLNAEYSLAALLASPPHRAILLDPSAVEVGIGYYFQASSTYGHYWVVVTGAP